MLTFVRPVCGKSAKKASTFTATMRAKTRIERNGLQHWYSVIYFSQSISLNLKPGAINQCYY